MQKCQEEFEGDFHPFYKNCGVGGGGRQFTNTGIALKFPTRLTSILHLHHDLAKAAYRAENYINLVELLISDKADLITKRVSGKSIWHHHRTRQYQSNIRLHIRNTSRDQHFRSHGSRSDHWIWDPECYGRIWYPCPWVLHRRSFCLHRNRTWGDRFWRRDFSVYCTTEVSASKATGW